MAASMSDEFRETEFVVVFPCSPCSKVEKRVESLKFCEDCKEYLCELCCKYHERFSATANHKVGVMSRTLVPKDKITEVPIPSTSPGNASREITGICVIRRGNHFLLAFTDWYAQLVRVLDVKTSKIIDSVSVGSKPYAIGYLPATGLLVATLRDTGEVVFIELTSRLKLRIVNCAQVAQSCRGMDVTTGLFNDTVVLVSGGHIRKDGHRGSVDIYAVGSGKDDLEMFQLKTFTPRSRKQDPLFFPKNITVDATRENIYVTDVRSGVLVFDKDGKRIGTVSNPCLNGARAICLDGDGNMYVGGMMSMNVVKFDPDGSFIGEITNKRFGLKCPICMCYDETSKSLIIGSKNDDVIRILKV